MLNRPALVLLQCLALLLAPHFAAAAMEARPGATTGPTIPELAWEARADWTSVKAAGAKGDGVADDTAAIQSALNQIKDGATIYFPPGVYRVTKTLTSPDGRFLGVSLLGHGSTSILTWDGEVGGRMFWSNHGMPCTRYVGLTWDGRGKAAVGIEHACVKIFETEVRHQHEAFLNFTEAGVRAGLNTSTATAETFYENCLFERCKHGVSLRAFNVLDHAIVGCEFRECSVGIYGGKGSNFYARQCHFEASGESDVAFLGESGSSVRQCTSHGSKQFLTYASSVGPLSIEDCRIDAWTHPIGAVQLGGATVLVFDTVFTNPPSKEAPIQIGNPNQRLILSMNSAGDGPLVKKPDTASVIEIPAGTRMGSITSAKRSFLRSKLDVSGKVFDAKRDFGAKGDGTTDDTEAIQKAIAAAREHGHNAVAYLAGGQFVVKQTLLLTGSDYALSGSGYRTALLWRGPPGGTTIEVRDVERVTLQNLAVGHHDCGVGDNAIDILQTGTGKASSMTYDRVWVWGMYQMKPLERGYRGVNLGKNDRVLFHEINGNLRFTDSAAATILLPISYEGAIVVEGKSTDRGGFLGGCVRLGTVTDPALWLRDNQSIVMSDFYVESSLHFIRMEGDAAQPAGMLVLSGAKFELSKPENNGMEVSNYRGEALLGPYQFYGGNPVHRFVQQGDAPFALTMLGCTFYGCKPEFKLAPGARLGVVGSYSVGLDPVKDKVSLAETGLTDGGVADALPRTVRALDALRKLGEIDLETNYGK
jgi:hypothetical protein